MLFLKTIFLKRKPGDFLNNLRHKKLNELFTFSRSYKDINVKKFFPPWIFLTAECFSLNCDLNGFRSKVNKHLSSLFSFILDFLYVFTFFSVFVTPCLLVSPQRCVEWILIWRNVCILDLCTLSDLISYLYLLFTYAKK